MKLKKICTAMLSSVLVLSMAACGSSAPSAAGSAPAGGSVAADNASSAAGGDTGAASAEKKRVCFVARASADTFAAWMTNEMKKAAEQYDNIELTCVSGEGDDNTENGLLEDCITKQYDLVIVQSNNNAAQAPYVKNLVDAGIPVITTIPPRIRATWTAATTTPFWRGQAPWTPIPSRRRR